MNAGRAGWFEITAGYLEAFVAKSRPKKFLFHFPSDRSFAFCLSSKTRGTRMRRTAERCTLFCRAIFDGKRRHGAFRYSAVLGYWLSAKRISFLLIRKGCRVACSVAFDREKLGPGRRRWVPRRAGREKTKSRERRKLQTSVAKRGISPSKAQQKLAQGFGSAGGKEKAIRDGERRGCRRRMAANV